MSANASPFGDGRSTGERSQCEWQFIPIECIEDLRNVVYEAGFEPLKFKQDKLSGSLAHASIDGITFNSGAIRGRFSLRGPLSESDLTIGVGLKLAPGSRHWYEGVGNGSVGVYNAGDEHTAFYTSGIVYATVSLSCERLEEEAAELDLVLDKSVLGGTGIHARRLVQQSTARLTRAVEAIHRRAPVQVGHEREFAGDLLGSLIAHLAREPIQVRSGNVTSNSYSRIVSRAVDFIDANLDDPISVSKIAASAGTSQRTLHRAFWEIFEDSPKNYVKTLRLNRARKALQSGEARGLTVAGAANHCGFSELGRFSGKYKDLFSELPSETLRRSKIRPSDHL